MVDSLYEFLCVSACCKQNQLCNAFFVISFYSLMRFAVSLQLFRMNEWSTKLKLRKLWRRMDYKWNRKKNIYWCGCGINMHLKNVISLRVLFFVFSKAFGCLEKLVFFSFPFNCWFRQTKKAPNFKDLLYSSMRFESRTNDHRNV